MNDDSTENWFKYLYIGEDGKVWRKVNDLTEANILSDSEFREHYDIITRRESSHFQSYQRHARAIYFQHFHCHFEDEFIV